jgi:hypothetical protein
MKETLVAVVVKVGLGIVVAVAMLLTGGKRKIAEESKTVTKTLSVLMKKVGVGAEAIWEKAEEKKHFYRQWKKQQAS